MRSAASSKAQLPSFRQGLAEFQSGYAKKSGGSALFSAAPEAQQIAWLHEADETPFFLAVRRLTMLGITSMPKYGGNFEGLGTKLLGVDRQPLLGTALRLLRQGLCGISSPIPAPRS